MFNLSNTLLRTASCCYVQKHLVHVRPDILFLLFYVSMKLFGDNFSKLAIVKQSNSVLFKITDLKLSYKSLDLI